MPSSPTKTRLIWITALVSTALYFALALWGWGGWRPFFAHPALVALAWVTLALTVAAGFSRGNLSPGVREDRGNRWVLAAFGILGLVDGFLPAYTDRVNFWTIDGDTLRWLGVALYAVGGILRIVPVFILGRRFSGLVAIQPGHMLVTTGLYAKIRNPSYLGLLVNSAGWALAFRSILGVLLTAMMIPILIARMHSEERLLHSQFGAEYDAYRARTARLLPGIY